MIIYPIAGKYKAKEEFDISVIVPMYKSKKVIAEQIRRWPNENSLKVEIIYVDDACPQKSCQSVIQEWRKRPDASDFRSKLILNKKNSGFGEACNLGAHHASGKYLIFLNADTVPEPNWLLPIFNAMEEDPTVGIVGNLQLKDGGEWHGTIDGAGSEWVWAETNFLHIGRHIFNGKYLEKPMYPEDLPKGNAEREMVTGCCLAIPKKLFETVGGFNHYYRIGYWEDSELCMSVKEKGYKIIFTPDSIVWHKLSHAKVGAHIYHDINKQYFMNKWDASGRLSALVNTPRPMKNYTIKRILIKREAANGDVLAASGVAAALKKKYPDAVIHFCTGCGQVLKENPFIDKIIDQFEAFNNLHKYQRIIELDGAYERRPKTHLLEAYADEAGVRQEDFEFHLHCEEPKQKIDGNYIVIHAGVTNWIGRNWDITKFETIAQRLLDMGKKVICIGKGGDRLVPCTWDARSRLNLYEMNWLIKNSDFFIGIDSMPMHCAQILDTPGVAFFGCVDPKLRIFNPKMHAVNAKDLPCIGCLHRKIAPSVTLNSCETKNIDCEKLITTEIMWSSIKKHLLKKDYNAA